jgi:hypothetical protein
MPFCIKFTPMQSQAFAYRLLVLKNGSKKPYNQGILSDVVKLEVKVNMENKKILE